MDLRLALALDNFVRAALAYCDAIARGEARIADRYLEATACAYLVLRDHGEPATDALLELLASDDLRLRYMAAIHVLEFSAKDGERVLETMALGPSGPMQKLATASLVLWRSRARPRLS